MKGQYKTAGVRGMFLGAVLLVAAFLSFQIHAALAVYAADTVYHDSAPDDYITERFDVTVEATQKHVFHFTETIDVNFIRQHHGIDRYIPVNSKLYSIKHIRVKGGDVSVSTTTNFDSGYQMGYKQIRIGDADTYLTGPQQYVLTYDMVCREDDDALADYLSLDLLPTGWDTSIREADLNLTLPKAVDPSLLQFYAGEYGTDAEGLPENDLLEISGDGTQIHIHVTDSPYGAGVTVQAALEEGYWVGAANHTYAFWIFIAVLIACPLISGILWFLYGRDPKIVKTVEFYPPDDMTPAELGYVIDGYVDKGDLSSMLMYFAAKGYLGIYEYKKKHYELRKLREIEGSGEKNFARTLFNGIFSRKAVKIDGVDVLTAKLDDMPQSYGKKIETAKAQIQKHYTKENALYTPESGRARVISVVLILLEIVLASVLGGYYLFNVFTVIFTLIPVLLAALIGVFLVLHAHDVRRSRSPVKTVLKQVLGWGLYAIAFWVVIVNVRDMVVDFARRRAASQASVNVQFWSVWPILLLLVSMFLMLFLAVYMRARTEKSAEWLGKILGFRDFIRGAEIDRLRVLQDSDPMYFYSMMPYAYVMGMGTHWAKKFTDIHVEKPAWYSTYEGGIWIFSPRWFGDMTRTTTRSYAGSFSNLPDSGSHGSFGGGGGSFSGGGFSGGGFGGGGGGAW